MRRLCGSTVSRAYRTAIGEQKTVVLTDGTTIQLNTDSRIEVVYTKDSRTIQLRRGEVHVSAAYDPHRVLEVHAAHRLVRALGTAFDVRVEGQAVEVMVTKGLVEVVDDKNARESYPEMRASPSTMIFMVMSTCSLTSSQARAV